MKEIQKKRIKQERSELRYKSYHMTLVQGGLRAALKKPLSSSQRAKMVAISNGITSSLARNKEALKGINGSLKKESKRKRQLNLPW